ncbi:MAG: hypothetical protein WC263_02415 [Candidatus Micrarchaeia archaeon]|jgi:hypothetical protein
MRYNAILLGIMMAFSLAFASAYSVVPLTYAALPADSYRVATQPGDAACAATSSGDFSYQNAKIIQIASNKPIFGGPDDALSGNYYFSKVLFDPIGLTGNGSTSLNGTYYQSANTAQWAPRAFWKVPGRDCWNWNDVIFTNPMIGVKVAGDPGTTWGFLRFEDALISGSTRHTMALNEGIGIGGANTAIEYISNSSYPTMRFRENDNAPQQVYYLGSMGGSYVSYEPTFITERGSRWLSVGTTDATAQVATKFAKPSFVFRTSEPPVGSTGWPQYTLETLITDTVDRTPKNRQNTLPEDQYPSMLSDPDTGGAITSPLRSVEQGTTIARNLFRIGGGEYAPFADYAVIDQQSSLGPYVEKQAYWAGTKPNGVIYDSGLKDIVVNRYSAMASSAKFEGNDFGIPVCTGGLNASTPDDYTSCSNLSSRTGSHRVGVRFLNKEWVISEMVAPTAPLASSTAAINGGRIRLAHESKYGILNTMDDSILHAGFDSILLQSVQASSSCGAGYSVTINPLGTNNQTVMCIGDIWHGITVYSATPGSPGKATLGGYNRMYLTPGQSLEGTNLTMVFNGTVAMSCPNNALGAKIAFYYGSQLAGTDAVCPDPAVNHTFMGLTYTLFNTSNSVIEEADLGTYNVQSLRVYTPSSTVLQSTPFSVRLNNVLQSYQTYGGMQYPALVDVLDTNMNVIGQLQINPGTTYTFTQSGTNNQVKIHVYQTHRGIKGLDMSWAEVAIYSDEIWFQDNMRYNLVSSQDPDKDFKVSLLWKNRGYTGGSSSTVADSLREIVVYNTDGLEGKTPRGGVFNFLNSQPAFRFAYAGINVIKDVKIEPDPLPIDSAQKGVKEVAAVKDGAAQGAAAKPSAKPSK